MNETIVENFNKLIIYYQSEKNSMDNPKAISFKIRNFQKALKILEYYEKEIKNGSQLKGIKGIGDGIIKRIDEILLTGKLSEIKEDDSKTQDSKGKDDKNSKNGKSQILKDLQRITGIGPVKAKVLYNLNLTLSLILDTYKEDPQDEIFSNFTHHQMIGIQYFHDIESRIPYKEINDIEDYLLKMVRSIDENLNITICGSYRRKKKDSGDIDVLITHKDVLRLKEIEDIYYLPELITLLKKNKFIVDDLTYNGNTKYMGMCRFKDNPARRIDIRFIPLECYGAALLYFTGSGEFNKNMRTFALKNGYTINEYGIYKLKETVEDGKKKKVKGLKIKANTEEDIFKILDMEYVEPEERTQFIKFI